MEYLHAGVEQDTLTALCTAPVHLQSLFRDQLLNKAEEGVARSEERRLSSQSYRKLGRFHPYASKAVSTGLEVIDPSLEADRKMPAGKERSRQTYLFLTETGQGF